MDWIEFTVEADQESVEAVAEVLHRFGKSGVSIEAVDPDGFDQQSPIHADRPVLVKVYVPADQYVEVKRQEIALALSYLSMIRPGFALQERRVVDKDWEEAWKEHFHVHRPGARTVIVPSWRDYTPGPDDIPLYLDPGMAFGTGLHPTTQLCIRLLEKLVKPGMEVLDVGTGSGVLAILAAKLGATRVLGLDTDPLAVEVSAENVVRNGVADVVQVAEGSLPLRHQDPLGIDRATWSAHAFDVVVANILASVIAELAPALVEALRPGGVLVCSGILESGFPHATKALLAAGAELVDVISDGDWRAIVLREPTPV